MVEQVPLLPYNLDMTEPPRLPVRAADDEGGPDFVMHAWIREQQARGVVLEGRTRDGETAGSTVFQ
jgi:alpha-D-xyloside xylohydrolase